MFYMILLKPSKKRQGIFICMTNTGEGVHTKVDEVLTADHNVEKEEAAQLLATMQKCVKKIQETNVSTR